MTTAHQPAIIIVGASGDIGGEIVKILRKNNSLFLTQSPFRNLTKKISDEDVWYTLDVTNSKEVDNFISIVEENSIGPIHLVYSVGFMDDHPIVQITDEIWKKILEINLTGAFYFIRRVFKTAAVRKNGKIILLGSVASKKGAVGQAAYSAAKAGLEALCRVASIELGRFHVTCNVVAPGAIESRMVRQTRPDIVNNLVKNTPLRKLGVPTDVAKFIEFLLSENSSHITGQTFYIDGGISAT